MKPLPKWVRLPSEWINDGGLKIFRWERGIGADNIAALMALQRGTDKAQKLLYSRAVSGWSST